MATKRHDRAKSVGGFSASLCFFVAIGFSSSLRENRGRRSQIYVNQLLRPEAATLFFETILGVVQLDRCGFEHEGLGFVGFDGAEAQGEVKFGDAKVHGLVGRVGQGSRKGLPQRSAHHTGPRTGSVRSAACPTSFDGRKTGMVAALGRERSMCCFVVRTERSRAASN